MVVNWVTWMSFELVVNWVVNWMLLEQGRRRCPLWSKMVRKGSDKVRDASIPVVCGSLTQPQAGEEPRTRSQEVSKATKRRKQRSCLVTSRRTVMTRANE